MSTLFTAESTLKPLTLASNREHERNKLIWTPAIGHRKLKEEDIGALKHLHDVLFPIDYAPDFFQRACRGDGIIGYAAVLPQSHASDEFPDSTTVFVGNEQLVGFITAKELKVKEIPVVDRHLLALSDPQHDETTLLYILTLGVAETFRKQGVATQLLELVERQAACADVAKLYLHVIDYNEPAARFYENSGFTCIATLPNFYHIQTGRALDPNEKNYGAFLYAKDVVGGGAATLRSREYFQSSLSSMVYLWHQFAHVCLPFGGNSRNKKGKEFRGVVVVSGGRHSDKPGTATTAMSPPPMWLKNLFSSARSATTASSASTAVDAASSHIH